MWGCVCMCVLHDMYPNKAQQENLKLCGRNEKYLPRMEKLTGVFSLRGSRVLLFLFPCSAGIFCWAELEWHFETQLMAEPDHPNMPWFGSQTNQNGSRSVFWFQCIFSMWKSYFPNPWEIWLNDRLINEEPVELPHVHRTFWRKSEVCFSHW